MMRLAVRLAMEELRHEWRAALCFVAALIGVLAPLLVLLALKNGVIDTMVGRLVDDPSNREVLAVGAGRFDDAFFAQVAQRADVDFVMPATRSINTSADAVMNPSNRLLERAVPLVPSAEGDPLLQGAAPVSDGRVHITEALAERLDSAAEGRLEMVIGREIDGRQELARRELRVIGVLPKARYEREAVFLSLPDLLAIERFRDDAQVTGANWTVPRPAPEFYASFRLYASSLTELRSLQDWLERQGVTVRPRAENAALLLAFRDNLNRLYVIVAALAIMGFWASMAANLRGMVERQRVSFSLLRLLGLSRQGRFLVPVLQSLLLVLGGMVLTFALVWPGLGLVNGLFETGSGDRVASLALSDVFAALILGALTALTASVWAVVGIAKIESSEVLRHA
jgi:putative ABC transport system permease protein